MIYKIAVLKGKNLKFFKRRTWQAKHRLLFFNRNSNNESLDEMSACTDLSLKDTE